MFMEQLENVCNGAKGEFWRYALSAFSPIHSLLSEPAEHRVILGQQA